MESINKGGSVGAEVLSNVARAIIGKDNVILRVFLAILARGHILIEDIPGVGKTTLAVAFSRALNLEYRRVQFTPDILPSDVTGFSIVKKDTGKLEFTPGAVMCNLFPADELNRATSRTQSALLEAMEEGQVTVGGASYPIPQPFIVIATQNPVGAAGTQLLPDSQMDRFMVRLSLGYPSHEDELSLVGRKQGKSLTELVQPVLSGGDLERMREEVDAVYIEKSLLNYIVTLVGETRRHPDMLLGASPRASLALAAMSRAMAYVQGRDYVIPKDISAIFIDAMAHRILMQPDAGGEGITAEKVLASIRGAVRVPRV